MQLHHVKHDEQKGNDRRHALGRVAQVAGVRIGVRVGHGAGDHQPADCGMEQDRNEDERPLHDRQRGPQRVDPIDVLLKGVHPVDHRGVGQQVHDHIGADRHEPAQAKQPVDQELVPHQE